MTRKQFLIEKYTNLREKAIENGFPNGWTVLLSNSVVEKLNAGVNPKKVENWAIKINKEWSKIL